MPILEAFVISRTLLWRGLLELVLAWLPLIIHALHSKLGPRSGKRDLASSLNLDSCQLAPLPKEVIKYGQLILVSQYLLFPSCLFFPPLILFSYPQSVYPTSSHFPGTPSFTSWVIFYKRCLWARCRKGEDCSMGMKADSCKAAEGSLNMFSLPPSQLFSVQERHCSWKYFPNMSA